MSKTLDSLKLISPTNEEVGPPLQCFNDSELENSQMNDGVAAKFQSMNWHRLKAVSEDRTLPFPMTFRWEKNKDPYINYKIIISKSNTLENRLEYMITDKDSIEIFHLEVGQAYYWKVEALQNEKILQESSVEKFYTNPTLPRWIHVKRMVNFRDIGGWKVGAHQRIKQSFIYRSSKLGLREALEGKEIYFLENTLNIKTEIDLRAADNCKNQKPVLSEELTKWINLPVRAYDGITEDSSQISYRKIFEIFGDISNYPIVYHCHGGCDRGGTVAFLLGGILGMNQDDLIRDYELSSLAIWGRRSRHSDEFKTLITALESFALGETEKNKWNALCVRYLNSIGVDDILIDRIRMILCEEIP